MGLRVEVLRHQTGGQQAAVEPIGPGVVGAHEGLGIALAGDADFGAAMPAHVEESVDPAGLVARHDDRFDVDVEAEEVPRGRDAAGVAGAMPVAPDHPLEIARVDVRIEVERPRQAVAGLVLGDQAVDRVGAAVHRDLLFDAHRALLWAEV